MKTFIEPTVINISDKFKVFEEALMSEMQNDLKYVTYLEDEYDIFILNYEIHKEKFVNQMDSIKPQFAVNEEKIKDLENKKNVIRIGKPFTQRESKRMFAKEC